MHFYFYGVASGVWYIATWQTFGAFWAILLLIASFIIACIAEGHRK